MLLAGLLLWSVVPVVAGWSSTVVMSNSMAPRLFTGDVVLVRPVAPDELQLGQILLVDDPDHAGRLRLHRLTGIDAGTGTLTLKGDANERADSSPVRTDAVHGVAALRVPWVGSPMVWLEERRIRLLAGTAAALTALAAGLRFYRPVPGGSFAGGPAGPGSHASFGGSRGSTSLSRGLAAQHRHPNASSDRTDTRPLYRVTDLADGAQDRRAGQAGHFGPDRS
jgi:signal peptidase